MFCKHLKLVCILIGLFSWTNTVIAQQCPNPVIVAAPGNNMQSLINNNPAGTCFYFPNGNYNFGNTIPKENMTFEGESRTGVQINGNGFENAFHGLAKNVSIRNLTLFNFNNNAGTNLQEQSPIRGSANIWAEPTDPLAEDWIIDNIESHSNIASGIFLGHNFSVTNSIFRDNGVTGIGGDALRGAYIFNNEIHHNGMNQAGGAQVNGGGLKITNSGTQTTPIIITQNNVYENTHIGIWGDVACHYWEIIGNTVSNNNRIGIYYEVSDHAIITDNIVSNNSPEYSGLPGNWCRGGITIAESAFVEASNNTVTDSKGGIVVQQTFRPFDTCSPGEFCEATFFERFDDITLVCSDIIVSHNTIIGASETGVGNAGSGFGQLSASSNIQFICNDYQNPENMDFYWYDGLKQNYSEWQAAGRDICSDDPNPDPDPDPDPNDGMSICKLDMEPVIDGIDDEWGLEQFELSKVLSGTIASSSDLAANFEVSWDDNNLYIYATIVDDQLIGDSQNAWEDDGLEVYIDGGNEKGTSYDANDHQLIFKLTDPNTVYYHSNNSINPQGVEYALTSSPGVSYVELKIDLSAFAGTVPTDGVSIGLDIHVNDDDNGGARDTKLSWNAGTDNAWNNPSLFGTFQFDDSSCHQECNLLTNSGFDNNLDDWIKWACDIDWDNGTCVVSNIQDVDNPWNAAVAYHNLVLENNTSYTLQFDLINIGGPRTLNIKVGKSNAPYTSLEYITNLQVPANTASYSFDFDMTIPTIMDGRLEFQCGTDPTEFAIDNVTLVEQGCDNGDDCQNVIVLSNPVLLSEYYANDLIQSTSTIVTGSDVSFYAGTAVELNADFEVELGAVFLADIQECF